MFILRAINHSRKEFLPTYVGIRLLLGPHHNGERSKFITDYVRRKAFSRKKQSYKSYLIYKANTADGQVLYRYGSAASPSTLLLEFYALDILSKDRNFSDQQNIYSYRWPGERSAQPWQFFFRGYQERNRDITKALSEDKDRRLLLFDLKNFYPSINARLCLEILHDKLSSSEISKEDRRIISYTAEQAVDFEKNGLPVGPPLSHALANIVMSSVDEQISGIFGRNYFRYVDDFALVVDKNSIVEASRILQSTVDALGFQINEQKTQIVTSEDWDYVYRGDVDEVGFSELRSIITTYLALRPSKISELRLRLRDAGFNLPLNQMAYVARGTGFALYLETLSSKHWRSGYLNVAISGIRGIISHALSVREKLISQLSKLSKVRFEQGTFAEKIRLKKISKSLGLMLYMHPLESSGNLKEYLRESHEYEHLRALLNACSTGNATDLLSYPGSVANTFAQIWAEVSDRQAYIDWSRGLNFHQLDAAASLSLMQTISIPENIVSQISNLKDKGYINFCNETMPKFREFSDFSYVDEVRSLQISAEVGSAKQLLSDRFDARQEVVIEGLRLSESYS